MSRLIVNDRESGCRVVVESTLLDAVGKRWPVQGKVSACLPEVMDVMQQLTVRNPSFGILILRICIGSAPLSILTASCATLLFPVSVSEALSFAVPTVSISTVSRSGDKLMGVNRHQDYVLYQNAVPNNLHWLDVREMRDAGFRIIRSAHLSPRPCIYGCLR